MAQGETAGQARGRERAGDEEFLKDEIRRRLEEARDSVEQAASKNEAAAQGYDSVKDAVADFDWRDEVKKRPLAWSLGALGVGLLTGYAVAAAIKHARGAEEKQDYVPSVPHAYAAQPIIGEHHTSTAEEPKAVSVKAEERKGEPAVINKVRESAASDRVRQELASLRDRFVDELLTIAHQVLLPALVRKIREALVSDKRTNRGHSATRSAR